VALEFLRDKCTSSMLHACIRASPQLPHDQDAGLVVPTTVNFSHLKANQSTTGNVSLEAVPNMFH